MIAYRPMQYRSPMNRTQGRKLSQVPANPTLVAGLTTGGLILDTLFSAGVAWVGFNTGVRTSGLLSVLGWVIGIGGGIRTAIDLFGLGASAISGEAAPVGLVPSAVPSATPQFMV